jgi:hypothetical protein
MPTTIRLKVYTGLSDSSLDEVLEICTNQRKKLQVLRKILCPQKNGQRIRALSTYHLIGREWSLLPAYRQRFSHPPEDQLRRPWGQKNERLLSIHHFLLPEACTCFLLGGSRKTAAPSGTQRRSSTYLFYRKKSDSSYLGKILA